MNKYQVIWLIIRLAGVYCAFLAITTLFSLLGSIPGLFTLPKIDVTNNKNANVSSPQMPSNPAFRTQPVTPYGVNAMPDATENKDAKTDESITDKFKGENVKNFAWFFVLTLIYGAVTWYLLRDGRLIFAILNREEPLSLVTKQKEAEVTTLNLSDQDK